MIRTSTTLDKRGTAEQWIKEGKQAVKMTRLSCHRFRSNQVRLALSLLAYNLGNLWRRLALPKRIESWSLTSLQQRLVKTGGRLVKHARYYWLLLGGDGGVSDKTAWEGRDPQLGGRIGTVWSLSRALGPAKENSYPLGSFDGYIVLGCWGLKRKFRAKSKHH
jgi:hypothetical protein